ncbi:MAG: hypothetical protein AABW89_00405 [Nanoarchaeota archaeon]
MVKIGNVGIGLLASVLSSCQVPKVEKPSYDDFGLRVRALVLGEGVLSPRGYLEGYGGMPSYFLWVRPEGQDSIYGVVISEGSKSIEALDKSISPGDFIHFDAETFRNNTGSNNLVRLTSSDVFPVERIHIPIHIPK